MVVAVGYQRCTFCGAIADSDRKLDVHHEFLDLLVQRSTTHDDFVSLTTKGGIYLLTDTLLHFLGDDGHLQQDLHGIALYLWEYPFADNLLDDQGNGNHQMGSYRLESLCDNSRGGQTVEEEQVVT